MSRVVSLNLEVVKVRALKKHGGAQLYCDSNRELKLCTRRIEKKMKKVKLELMFH
jgi:hypothetical protein